MYRTFVGEYATSMEMAGASISICRMADQEMKQWIDMPVLTLLCPSFGTGNIYLVG